MKVPARLLAITRKLYRVGKYYFQKYTGVFRYACYKFRYRNEPSWNTRSNENFFLLEDRLTEQGIKIHEFVTDRDDLDKFMKEYEFDRNYRDQLGDTYAEKIFEHYVSYRLLDLKNFTPEDIYLDIAGCESPWAMILRSKGFKSFSIDLEKSKGYGHLDYYKVENAVSTKFSESSVKGASLQCSFEHFSGDSDMELISELARILQPGGKTIIVPLYLSREYCGFSSPDMYKKNVTDTGFREYIHWGFKNMPCVRIYDIPHLLSRVISQIISKRMNFRIYTVRNKEVLPIHIYCQFILEITR